MCQKNFGFTVLVFIVVGEFPNFGTWFSVFIKSTNRFLDLVSEVVFGFSYLGFQFLFDLRAVFLPPWISHSCETSLCSICQLYRID